MSTSPRQGFRIDIQGIRGFAILLVVVYHTELFLPGGFIGVDVFFVVSGFVVTSSLRRGIARGDGATVRDFYLRRARRILPSYCIVLVASSALAALFFDPYVEFSEIRLTAVASLLMSANLHLLTLDTYDDLAGNPLRHLWSLGVEEHFYLIYPLVFLALAQKTLPISPNSFKFLYRALVWGFILSLAVMLSVMYLPSRVLPLLDLERFSNYAHEWSQRLAFFLSPLRFWQILAGAIAALHPSSPKVRKQIASSGVCLAVISIIWIALTVNSHQRYPSLLAIVPVVATVVLLVLLPSSSMVQLFSNRLMTFLGDISYSLYLWHWPILVTLQRVFASDILVAATTLSMSICLAWISTNTFEQAFLGPKTRLRMLGGLVVAAVISLLLPSLVIASDSFQQRFPRTESKTANFAESVRCASVGGDDWSNRCVFGNLDSDVDVYLFGDSNARSASDGFAMLADSNDWRLTLGIRSACPVNFVSTTLYNGCDALNNERYSTLLRSPPDVLVIVNHWTNYLDFSTGNTGEQSLVKSLSGTLAKVRSLGIKVILQYQIPDCDFRNQIINIRYFEGEWTKASRCLSTSRTAASRNRIGREVLRIAESCEGGCRVVDLTPVLCNEVCQPFKNGVNMFADRSHISASASRLTARLFADAMRSWVPIVDTG